MGIVISGLRKTYGNLAAVENLDLTVAPGEMLVLLGPSGSGKTTAMRCVVGLEQPDHGSVAIGGKVVFDSDTGVDVSVNRRNIGMVFQSYAIWPHKTVFENVAFGLRMKKVKKELIRERVNGVMRTLDIVELADRGASLLSGGQMQRVALARSLAMHPQILLFDEPLSNLDAKLRDRLRFEIKSVQQQFGITAMYVTHDQSEALALADRIAVMRAGKIEQLSDPIELYKKPANEFVADFLGVKNLFHARVVERRSDATVVETIDHGVRFESRDTELLDDLVCVCVRPEDLSLGGPSDRITTNSWASKVELASFLGSSVAYQVSVAGGLRLHATVNDRDIHHRAGSQTTLSVPADRVQLLPVSGHDRE